MMTDIGKMDMSDLLDLNRQVVGLIKYKRTGDALRKGLAFHVGDKVAFNSKSGSRMTGTIERKGRVNCIVSVGNLFKGVSYAHTRYRVPYGMLSAVKGE